MKKLENQIILAPMEGVLDKLMRELLTSINSYDLCITEFVRVVDSLVPKHVFRKTSPELCNNGQTKSGTPIRVQLLGQNPDWMSENACRAIDMGSNGIDINFGCPAKAVNKSKGGAVLLKEPEKIYQIVNTVRKAIPKNQPLSVKIRLGFDDSNLFDEIVDAIVSANAQLLTVHARTKKQGYIAPAYWHKIGQLALLSNINIVANGEIWTRTDAFECMDQSKTSNIMLGRGALATPNLANTIKSTESPMSWECLSQLIRKYSVLELKGDKSFYFSSRLKQWLRYLRLQYTEADELFKAIKILKNKEDILKQVEKYA